MTCPTCGATENVHGDCLVCDAPFGAPQARTVYVRNADFTGSSATATLTEPRPAGPLDAHLAMLPASYARRHGPDAIARHVALIDRAAGGTVIEHSRTGGIDRLTVVTADRPGLLELLAGTLTVQSVSIAAATAFTRADGIVIDEIEIAPRRGGAAAQKDWSAVCAELTAAISGGRTPDQLAEKRDRQTAAAERRHIPTMVYVHNAPTDRYSKIEVNAADRPGLLYAITRALREEALSVHLAEVETVGALAVDTFYVVDGSGQRVEQADAIARIRSSVRQRIDELDQD